MFQKSKKDILMKKKENWFFKNIKNALDFQFELILLKFNIEHLDRNSLLVELSKVLEGLILTQIPFH